MPVPTSSLRSSSVLVNTNSALAFSEVPVITISSNERLDNLILDLQKDIEHYPSTNYHSRMDANGNVIKVYELFSVER